MIPDAVQRTASSYLENLRPFMEKETSYTQTPPIGVIHNRIHQMWYNGSEPDASDHQHVHCTAVKVPIAMELIADSGQTRMSNASWEALSLTTDELRQYKQSGVKWVYVPVGMFWETPPRPASSSGDQASSSTSSTGGELGHHYCMLVLDNVKMQYDVMDPLSKDAIVHIRDAKQKNEDLVIRLHSVFRCHKCKPLFPDYAPTYYHTGLLRGVRQPLQCMALVFLTMACCRRYQIGNPWDVANAIIERAYHPHLFENGSRNRLPNHSDPLVNWLRCIHECMSWEEVSVRVGLLRKGSDERAPAFSLTRHTTHATPMPPCGVLMDGDLTRPCLDESCHRTQAYHHAYCPKHRFALILQTWAMAGSYGLYRYVSEDVWSVKADPLPIGDDDGTQVGVDDLRHSLPIHGQASKRRRLVPADNGNAS